MSTLSATAPYILACMLLGLLGASQRKSMDEFFMVMCNWIRDRVLRGNSGGTPHTYMDKFMVMVCNHIISDVLHRNRGRAHGGGEMVANRNGAGQIFQRLHALEQEVNRLRAMEQEVNQLRECQGNTIIAIILCCLYHAYF